jgi:hypothetical protein
VQSLNQYLCERSVQEEPNTNTKSHISIFDVQGLYGHSLYLVCPDVLSLVGELLSADGVVHRITYCFSYFLCHLLIYLFIYTRYKRRAVIKLKQLHHFLVK